MYVDSGGVCHRRVCRTGVNGGGAQRAILVAQGKGQMINAQALFEAKATYEMLESELYDFLAGYAVSFTDYRVDSYDSSLELHGVAADARLPAVMVTSTLALGFAIIYVNHTDGWETHYTKKNLEGWRRKSSSVVYAERRTMASGEIGIGHWYHLNPERSDWGVVHALVPGVDGELNAEVKRVRDGAVLLVPCKDLLPF